MARKKGASISPFMPAEEQPYSIPENWCWTYWGNIGEFTAGNGFKNEYQGFTKYPIPFYKVGSLKYSDENGILYDISNTINEDIRNKLKATLIPAQSIIFAKIGEAIRLNRRSINTVPCCIDNNLMAFRARGCFWRYAFYWSLGLDLYIYTNATTVPAIRKSDLEAIPFPLPPLSEQHRIVARIESLFAKLDEAKEKAQAVVDGFELRKSAILHKAFTGELTERWRKEHGVGLESWETKPLVEVASLQTGLMKGKRYEGETIFLPYLRVANVQDGYLDLTEIKEIEVSATNVARYSLKKGDVLFTEGGDFDKLGRGTVWEEEIPNCLHQNHIFVVRPHESILNSYFLSYQAGSKYGKTYFLSCSKQTTNLASINSTQLKGFPVKLPSLSEQLQIVSTIDNLIDKENQARNAAEAVLDQIDTMKKAILARAFRGELGTNDPAEEWAGTLVELKQ